MEGMNENFSLSRQLSMHKVKQIFQLAKKHGATLSEIRGPSGVIKDEDIERCRSLAIERLKTWANPWSLEQTLMPVILKKTKTDQLKTKPSSIS